MRRALLLIALIAAVLAAGVGWYGVRQYESLVVTRPFVVAKVAIAPYTVITADMLTTQELPAVLAGEQPVYVRASEVVGTLATTEIPTGTLIYRHQAVPAASFRYTDDPRAEVIALGLPPEQAVAGQVQAGQRVNVYRISWGGVGGESLATLLVERALVRGVYRGETDVAGTRLVVATGAAPGTLVILLLEVSPVEAQRLVQWMADRYETAACPSDRRAASLWVSLAPLVTSPPVGGTAAASPEPSPTPGSTRTPAAATPASRSRTATISPPLPTRRVVATPTARSLTDIQF